MQAGEKKVWLNEVSFIRPILLVLLVSYHAFAPWCGAWDMPTGCNQYEPYKWIALISKAFLLEAFVFISGYIFKFQLVSKRKFESFRALIINKLKRLYLPCLLFGTIYFVCFKKYVNIQDMICQIASGVGHLWYLPCLFWCFLVQYVVVKSNIKANNVILILCGLLVLSIVPLPMQLNETMYYMLFFYAGGLYCDNYQKIVQKAKLSRILFEWGGRLFYLLWEILYWKRV